ncbi:acidic amino acid decarboxylase GADL1 [Diceros bicornis minor]|uniref:acidic amino acid decarboxylase GADL1 n=1 Tax=Diceros bicornis minor TaxID=77932 RepID=UPI0026F10F4F|nr:acidic amino acid decarboxylase GADL1 [Diceros bicornis minor]
MWPAARQVLIESRGLQEAGSGASEGGVKAAPSARPRPSPCSGVRPAAAGCTCGSPRGALPQQPQPPPRLREPRPGAARSGGAAMSSDPDRECPVDGDIDQEEMVPSRKSAVLVDGFILNGPTTDAKAGEKFVEEACRLIMEEVVLKATDINEKVCEWRSPEQLKQLLDLEMRDTGEPHHRLLELCQDVIRYSVKTNHPRFFNQLYAGLDYYSLVARFMTEALNPSVYTYEVSPVFLLVEEAVLKKMIEFIGWKEGDGIFNPGGSVSNMYAMNLARYKYCPDIKEKGLSGLPRLILFTSAECHYSMKKAASFLGIGTDNVCFVETDGRGKMIPEELEKQIWQARKEGAAPFLVCATSGTTVLGAFDPLDEIADICEQHGLWLHVDASWGGSALLSRKHRKLLHGIHRADSVAWNPHKMLMSGIQCCALLVKDKSDLLKKCYSAKASYLFQQDKFYDVSYDTGDKSIQCSRRPDAFKFWMTWKALGTSGLEERVNRALALSRYLVEEMKKREGFKLLLEPEYANICFWYIPPSLREMEEGPEFWAKLNLVAPAIKERMMKKGSLMLGYQPHRGKVNFFRQVVISPQVSREDMDFLLDEIDLLGRDM